MSSADYFCLIYASLILFSFVVQLVFTSIMYALFGDEFALIYTNIAAIICITLANMVPNRREEEIKLESAELSLAMKEAFVRYLSHEMRTPINVALVGLLMHEQYMKERDLLTEECNDTLKDVKGAIDVALETLNEALNYEKLQSKVMALEKTKEDPFSFVLSSTSMFKASAANAGVSLILPQATDVVWPDNSWVDIDLLKMSQVMRNFMSNALKFSSVGGSITVGMRIVEQQQVAADTKGVFDYIADFLLPHRENYFSIVSDPWLEISVKDEGVGIEPEFLPRIFNEVLQINPNKNQGGKGTGMGLYISKGITELNGGRVEVHSDGLGQGSCFKILLPLHIGQPVSPSTTTAQVSPLNDSNQNVVQNAANDSDAHMKVQRYRGSRIRMSVDTSFTSSDVQEFTTCDNGTSLDISDTLLLDDGMLKQTRSNAAVVSEWTNDRLRGRRVLMVDDSPTNLKMCVKLLKKLGADVDKAEDGRIAVEMVQSLLREQAPLLSSSSLKHPPAVRLSNERDIAEYIAQGANAVLKKPLVLAELFKTLNQIDAQNKV
eukprot:gene27063-35775_t